MIQGGKVVLVDDDESIHAVVTGALRREKNKFRLAACFTNVERALAEIPLMKPDFILMDILFNKGSGIDCVRQLSPMLPKTGIIMLTVSHSANHIFESLVAGAHAYIIKRDIPEKIIPALQNVGEGSSELSPSVARKIVDFFRSSRENPQTLALLTEREAQVLRALSKGLTNKEVAIELSISIQTMQTHLRNIYGKLRVHSRREAVLKFRSAAT